MTHPVCVYIGEALANYNFGESHPFGPQRHDAFVEEFNRQSLNTRVDVLEPVQGTEQQLLSFHTPEYIELVKQLSTTGNGYLDGGDTPAFLNMFDIALGVVGTTLDAVNRVMSGKYQRAFTPIGGLHHARRDSAAGFCVFNDCGVAIEVLRKQHAINKVAYVDIDAHHGDGVFYSFDDDPDLCFIDMHEDGCFLYPGTGAITETGTGTARGTKLNIPMPMYANDELFLKAWEQAELFLRQAQPEFILLQCGADSINGDPITHMQYSEKSHAHAARRLCILADELCEGRLVAMGGGGYNLNNLARGWTAVVDSLVKNSTTLK
jgi:acetoin utilization protein AcuC